MYNAVIESNQTNWRQQEQKPKKLSSKKKNNDVCE